MPKPTRQTGFQRFMARVHAHPQARLLEFLLWGGPGALLVALAVGGWRLGWFGEVVAILGTVVGLCFIGWGLLPPRQAKPKAPPPGRLRRQQAERRGR